MAEYFAGVGWDDITIAFPFVPQWAEAVNRLAKDISVNITFSSAQNLLASYNLINEFVGVFIEVDVGYGRTGVQPENTREIALMLNLIKTNEKFTFKGFLVHAGQSYGASGKEQVLKIHNRALTQLIKLKSFWKEQYPNLVVSYGDTPTCSIADEFWGVDEIRPGNFIFYDVMQSKIGSCKPSQIAVALICPVVDSAHEQGKIVVHGGAVHLSKERIKLDGADCYGLVCRFDGKTWSEPIPGAMVTALSQEHGTISYVENSLNTIKPGELLAILPIHSCLTVDCMGAIFDSELNQLDVMRK